MTGGTARAAFWIAVAVGWVTIAFAAWGIWSDRGLTEPVDLARWFASLVLVHDLALVPLTLAVAWAVGRVVPPAAVVPVRLGLASAALLVALAWPLVRRYGARESNPSLLPLPYGRNAAIAVALWTAVIAAMTVAVATRRRRRP